MISKLTRKIAGVAIAAATVAGVGAAGVTAAHAAPDDAGLFPQGRVIAQPSLTVRSAPTLHAPRVGSIPYGTQMNTYCKVAGTVVDGNMRWYQVDDRRWVAARYVQNLDEIPGGCGSAERFIGRITADVSVWRGPSTDDSRFRTLRAGQQVKIICKVSSEKVDGNRLWYRLNDATWAPARYLANVGQAPMWC